MLLTCLLANDMSLAYLTSQTYEIEQTLNTNVSVFYNWSKVWLIDFNANKTKVLSILNTSDGSDLENLS